MTDFFRNTVGFDEEDYETTKAKLLAIAAFSNATERDLGLWDGVTDPSESADLVVGERCVLCRAEDGERIDAGVFYAPSVQELRDRVDRVVASLSDTERVQLVAAALQSTGSDAIISVSHIVGDSRHLHCELENANSVMQAASQFNYLEFPSPNTTPEKGIANYVFDRTQGPACATACAAGTIVRNYLAVVRSTADGTVVRGQTKDNQLNGLADVTSHLTGNGDPTTYYTVRNGYVESTKEKLAALNEMLAVAGAAEELVALLRVGVQEDTRVTDEAAGKRRIKHVSEEKKVTFTWEILEGKYPLYVTQVYCSALSIGYSRLQSYHGGTGPWDPFARVVLNATYEATFLIAVLNTIKLLRRKRLVEGRLPRTLLTKVGGGVFANNPEWIMDAVTRAANRCLAYGVPLDVRMVHYGGVEDRYIMFPTSLMAGLPRNRVPHCASEARCELDGEPQM